MSLPLVMLENTEVFDAFEENGRQPMLISAPDRGVLLVFEDDANSRNEQAYTDEEFASTRKGLDAIDRGETIGALQMLAEIRAEYGL